MPCESFFAKTMYLCGTALAVRSSNALHSHDVAAPRRQASSASCHKCRACVYRAKVSLSHGGAEGSTLVSCHRRRGSRLIPAAWPPLRKWRPACRLSHSQTRRAGLEYIQQVCPGSHCQRPDVSTSTLQGTCGSASDMLVRHCNLPQNHIVLKVTISMTI